MRPEATASADAFAQQLTGPPPAVGEFAGKMHDDLVDGVDWAVAEGYADLERVAIFGGFCGGCATLVGITVTPMYLPRQSITSASPTSKTSRGRCPS